MAAAAITARLHLASPLIFPLPAVLQALRPLPLPLSEQAMAATPPEPHKLQPGLPSLSDFGSQPGLISNEGGLVGSGAAGGEGVVASPAEPPQKVVWAPLLCHVSAAPSTTATGEQSQGAGRQGLARLESCVQGCVNFAHPYLVL